MSKVIRNLVEYNGVMPNAYSGVDSFKQMNADYVFCIPKEKPDIEQLLRVWVDTEIIEYKLVKTPKGTSLEGQIVTGYKLLITGDINLKFQYVADNNVQSVHIAQTKFPYCGYVVLPNDTNPNGIVRASVVVEDILTEKKDCRSLYINITMMLVADIC